MRQPAEAGRVLAHVDRFLDIPAGLLEDLAHLLRHQPSELFLALLDDERRLQGDLAPGRRRRVPPAGEGFLGRLDGGVDILPVGRLHHSQHLIFVGRVGGGEGLARLRLDPLAADVVPIALGFGLLPLLPGHRLTHAATSWNAALKICHPSSSSCCERLSGGTSRSTLSSVPQLKITNPESRHTCRIFFCRCLSGLPCLSTSSTPTIMPSPRTSPIEGIRCWRSRRRRISSAPLSRAFSITRSRLKTSSVAMPAAHDTGLPPKVDPCAAGSQWSISLLVATTALSGRPEAIDLASVMMSGVTPKCSTANILPVRP